MIERERGKRAFFVGRHVPARHARTAYAAKGGTVDVDVPRGIVYALKLDLAGQRLDFGQHSVPEPVKVRGTFDGRAVLFKLGKRQIDQRHVTSFLSGRRGRPSPFLLMSRQHTTSPGHRR